MEGAHPLKDRWTFWYLKHERTRHWETCLCKLVTVSTLEQLISVMESIEPPSHFVVGADYYLFREGIKPSWGEEYNTRGGRWSLPVTKRHRNLKLDTYWAELVSAMVGEQFGDDSDQICGAAVSVRFRTDRLSVWTRDAFSREGNETNQRIGEIVMEELRLDEKEVDSMDYASHKQLRRKATDG